MIRGGADSASCRVGFIIVAKKPTKITASGIEWTVKYCKKHPKLKGRDGFCDHPSNTIYIDGKLNETAQHSTLLHEIIHIVERTHRVKLSEDQVLGLEAGLFQIIHDNKLVF